MTSVVIADVDGYPASRAIVQGLARRLRRGGAAVTVCHRAGGGDEGNVPVSAVVRRELDRGGSRPVVVLFGDETRQRRLVWGLTLSGLLPRIRLVVQTGAARIPYEPLLADVFARAEVVVAESEVGARAVRQCCAEAGEPTPRVVVTPPVFPSRPRLPERTRRDRRAVRRAQLDMGDDALVVGCWARDGLEQVLAMRIFQQFIRGRYWRCDHCGHLTPWPLDDLLCPVPTEQCRRCGSSSGTVGRARDDTRLVLIGGREKASGGWEAREVGSQLGLGDRIVHETDAPTAGPTDDPAPLWEGVDIHLQPHLLADLPAPMRASCVLGVPIVATRYGAVEESLAGAAKLVPPRMVLDHSAGHRIALMDPGGALVELCRLADDRTARRSTAARLRELAHRCGTDEVLSRWVDLLDVPVAT